MSESQVSLTAEQEAFMKETPTREEVNRYMNNLYMAVNNSFGMYQGYTIMAIASTLKEYFTKHNIEIDSEEFLKIFFEHNQKLLKEAADAISQAKAATTTEAPAPEPEVDISML